MAQHDYGSLRRTLPHIRLWVVVRCARTFASITRYQSRIHARSFDMDDEALNQVKTAPKQTKETRRGFLKILGVSSAGMTLATAAAASKEKIKQGGEDAKIEIEKLKKAYEELDRRSQLILRIVLVMSGLDIFM